MNTPLLAIRRCLCALAAVAAVSLVVSACSGDDGPTPTPAPVTPTPVPSGTITATGGIAYITPAFELAVANPDGSSPQIIYDAREVVSFEWSPDGSLIAAVVRTAGGTNLVGLSPTGDVRFEVMGASSPLWSPGGTHLTAAIGEDTVILDSVGQEVISLPSATRPAWSPDGLRVAYLAVNSDGQGVPEIVDVGTGNKTFLAEGIDPDDPIYPIAWHPAGEVIAYRDSLYEPAAEIVTPTEGVPIEWSPDGRILVQALAVDPTDGSTEGAMFDFSRGGEKTIAFSIRPSGTDEPPWLYIGRWTDWSADGRIFMYLDPQPGRVQVRLYDTVAIAQERFQEIQGMQPEISPSNTHAVFHDGGKVWVLALDGSALVNIVEGTNPTWRPNSS